MYTLKTIKMSSLPDIQRKQILPGEGYADHELSVQMDYKKMAVHNDNAK